MRQFKGTNLLDFKKELLENGKAREEYERLKPKYELIHALIERRHQLRMSQERLAHITGTKQPAISRLERGDYNTRVGTFLKVVQALNLDLQVLPKSPEVRRGESTRAQDKRRQNKASICNKGELY